RETRLEALIFPWNHGNPYFPARNPPSDVSFGPGRQGVEEVKDAGGECPHLVLERMQYSHTQPGN
ncbi:hypothetical protein P7K49_002459, partial [Saguinus oedipus]